MNPFPTLQQKPRLALTPVHFSRTESWWTTLPREHFFAECQKRQWEMMRGPCGDLIVVMVEREPRRRKPGPWSVSGLREAS